MLALTLTSTSIPLVSQCHQISVIKNHMISIAFLSSAFVSLASSFINIIRLTLSEKHGVMNLVDPQSAMINRNYKCILA